MRESFFKILDFAIQLDITEAYAEGEKIVVGRGNFHIVHSKNYIF